MTRMAKVFDGAVDGVPYYRADHPRLTPIEREPVLAYLGGGTPVLVTTASEPDFVEPRKGEVVPMSFRTDGDWVWNDALAYYVEEYGYAPEPEFVAAMEAAGWRCPAVGDEVVEEVLGELFGE